MEIIVSREADRTGFNDAIECETDKQQYRTQIDLVDLIMRPTMIGKNIRIFYVRH